MSKLTQEQYDKIKQRAEFYKKDMTAFLREIVKYPGESCQEKEHIRVISEEMKKVGFDEVKIDKQGNVLGFMGEGSRIFAFDAHIDTVGIGNAMNWKFDLYEGYENEREIGGRGTSDQLGGIVSAVYGAKIMKDLNLIPKDVKILVTGTVQEEDCDGLCWQYIIREDKIIPEFVVSTEPTDGGIYRGHRGRMEIKVYVKGISCHGSAPERGDNAIYKMTDILNEVRALNENGIDGEIKGLVKMLDKNYNKEWEAANFLGRGTVTVSQIGYTSPSRCAVADGCWCSLDRRMTAGETFDYCLDEIRNLPSCKKYAKDVKVTMYDYDSPSYTGLVYPIECYFPTWWTRPDDPLCISMVESYKNLFHTDQRMGDPSQLEMRKKRPLLDKWTFSTNGVTIKGRNGIDCIGFGPGAEAMAHAPNEITWKCDLVTCAAMYATLPTIHVANVPKAKIYQSKAPILKPVNVNFDSLIQDLAKLKIDKMFGGDYFLTWDKTDDELLAIWNCADILRSLREKNISCKVFNSGLGISLFRDNSTRTRFSFVSACNLLGLEVQDFDEGKSQIAHGETVRETSNMISFMADVIGIRDDMYIGKGHTYMKNVIDSVTEGNKSGVLEQKPLLVNLQCDIDHPTQIMADALHCIHQFGGIENLKGKKIAMTWAYSPSYGKPLSVPQGVIGLFTRLGMDVSLAYPEGYEIMPEVIEVAKKQAETSGGKFTITNNMKEAFKDADIVYPKSWAPFKAMEKRTVLYGNGDSEGIKKLEKELLAQNATHKDWACTEEMMKLTKNGEALYLHCLPADISGVSCEMGEVDASVFDRYRDPLYKQASYKPYIIAAMIFLSKFKDPITLLKKIKENAKPRIFH